MPPAVNFDLATIDLNRVIADKDAIRKINPQRFEMEQLDAIVYIDVPTGTIIGYKDVRDDEFWVRGHMPNYPLMPGVIICEAAAQLCSYFVVANKICGGDFMGFGGLENVRFRGTVHPGDRLVIVAKATKLHRRQTICNVQAFVKDVMVFHGDVIGVPMTRSAEGRDQESPK
jgi:3-hydroxyacyl-[acyl-carrier-protein] dehydratase